MHLNKSLVLLTVVIGALFLVLVMEIKAQRRGGGRVGGGRGGGGRVGGGRTASRPPSRPASRPASRPSVSRPSRPSTTRPSVGRRPSTGSRPSIGSGSRPSIKNRPSTGARPKIGRRPSTGTRPGIGNRPDLTPGRRPSIRPGTGNRPGVGTRPGSGNRPGAGRPSQLPTLPGLGGGNRPPGTKQPPGAGRPPGSRPPGAGRPPGSRPPGSRPPGAGRPPAHRPPHGRPPAYGRYRGWHHGYQHGSHWKPGNHLKYWWNRYPVMTAIGVTTWTINRVGWATGYSAYSNPYVGTTVVDNSVYNYSQPIVVESQPETTSEEGNPPDVSERALGKFDAARQNFFAGKYAEALVSVNAAIKEMPNDAVLHEFRALVLFAQKNYREAAATLHAVLSAGPGWDWTTMSGLYPDVATYTKQFRALEQFRESNSNDPSAALVLAYHYTTAGHEDAAKDLLVKLVSLTPNDPLARNLLDQADPNAKMSSDTNLAKPPEITGEIDAAKLMGTWKASRGDGSNFELKLGGEDDFVWIFSNGKDRQELTGPYSIDRKGVISLDMGKDGIMPAQLVPQGNNKMDFYMLGDSQGAEPLKFSR